jgi:cytochrome subunit of sulfide dehydrogenase
MAGHAVGIPNSRIEQGRRSGLTGRLRRSFLFVGMTGILAGPVSADFTEGELLAGACGGCHGHTGVSIAAGLPSIAGFDRRYLVRVMREFGAGTRHSTIMGRLMKGYTPQQMDLLASHYAAQAWESFPAQRQPALYETGQQIHEALCEECHEQAGRYQDRDMPRVAGQAPDYLLLQLFARRDRPDGMQQPSRMRRALENLSDDELRAVGHFISSQD